VRCHFPVLLVGALLGACALVPAEPEWVTNRRPLPACGVEWVSPEGGMDGDARRCLLAAWEAGEEAELITHLSTADGDAVTRFVRVHANGTNEIFVDATLDALGSGRWERFGCDAIAPVEDGDDAGLIFTEQGCVELPIP
jgi:hypothetical protein